MEHILCTFRCLYSTILVFACIFVTTHCKCVCVCVCYVCVIQTKYENQLSHAIIHLVSKGIQTIDINFYFDNPELVKIAQNEKRHATQKVYAKQKFE